MHMLKIEDVRESHKRIKGLISKTELRKSIYLSDSLELENGREYFLKLENMQIPRSFKVRGAFSKLTTLSEAEKNKGVVAISSGNHGAAVSYASSLMNIKNVNIVVPKNTPTSKVDYIEFFGGRAIKLGDNFDEAHELGEKFIKENDLTLIDAYYDDKDVYAGQGTVALEIMEQNPDIDTILVPIGGGGLATGISVAARAINPNVRIIGLQTEACPAMIKAIEDDVFYDYYPTEESICDALVGGVGKLAFDMAKETFDDVIAVKEEYIKKAVVHMMKKEKVVAEPASAICVGAVMQDRERIGGKQVALIITGGNLSEELMSKLLAEV